MHYAETKLLAEINYFLMSGAASQELNTDDYSSVRSCANAYRVAIKHFSKGLVRVRTKRGRVYLERRN